MCDRYSEIDLLDYRQGRLTSDDAAAVVEHLRECADCQRADRLAATLCLLKETPELPLSELATRQVRERIAMTARQRRARHRVVARLSWSAAACLVLGIGLWWAGSFRTSTDALGHARVENVSGSVTVNRDGAELQAGPGTALHRNDRVAVASGSSAVVALAGTSRVELGSRTTMSLSGANVDELFLEEGFVAVDAGKSHAVDGLHLRTPSAVAEVHGTRFTLAVHDGDTNLRVAEGKVRFTRIRDRADMMVSAGHRASVTDAMAFSSIPSRTGEVLLIVSREKAQAHWHRFNQLLEEHLVGERLQRLAFRVTLKDQSELRAQDLINRPLVVISLAESDIGLEASLTRAGLPDANVPVICLEGDAYPPLGLTGPGKNRGYGWGEPKPPLVFPRPGHALAAGLAPQVDKLFGSFVGWGRPGPGADVVLTMGEAPGTPILFSYETDAKMVGRRAPARRVGMFLDPVLSGNASSPGWRLFDAAVDWCTEATDKLLVS